MAAGSFERVKSDALAQVAAGAQMLDVNAEPVVAIQVELAV
jgi:cobalamin-dependent methionine synthase I